MPLIASDIHFARNLAPVLRGVSLQVESGQLLQVTGANGCGKTSLLKILCGLITPDRGEVRWNDSSIWRLASGYRAQIAYVGHKDGIAGDLTPLENLEFAAAIAGEPAADVQPALRKWGLDRQDRPCRLLSAGQRRRLALARLELLPAKLWILDEPLTVLDEAGKQLLGESIEQHTTDGGCAIMATHQQPGWQMASFSLAL
ncbi:MAG: cytochrome c biogenesis heme-transporting ATPase CcmA [Betaproteobacteria bacterium]|nr:cytochrome c biogenesis heme-transporting ATPase CcmA [Betaproteobacteria bacterium]